ncbi:MAG: hypothetical protein MZU97_07535 [Bacillus subtilis]|nr:hypothetical protein [Bacillus subtilis]
MARLYELMSRIYFYSNETLPIVYTAIRFLNEAEKAGRSPEAWLRRMQAWPCWLVSCSCTNWLRRTWSAASRSLRRSTRSPIASPSVW